MCGARGQKIEPPRGAAWHHLQGMTVFGQGEKGEAVGAARVDDTADRLARAAKRSGRVESSHLGTRSFVRISTAVLESSPDPEEQIPDESVIQRSYRLAHRSTGRDKN